MLNFALEVSKLANEICTMDTIATKIASADSSLLAQHTTAIASNSLYNVMIKEAQDRYPESDANHKSMTSLINKLAAVLGKGSVSRSLAAKIASAVVTDDVLNSFIHSETDQTKIADYKEMQRFGREYFVTLLRDAFK